ncbi:MAG: NUDIX domain-containing protein [Candidatus Paceibacterota bacterium]|nr:MAG: NUDIX domain-containing protein [Candidatus Paceibacterota bacterium]
MATIHKKVWREYFEKIISGKKKLELRLADFEINEGDTLILEEWDKDKKEYTGRKFEAVATYILKTKDQTFWSQEEVEKHGFQIIQFEPKDSLAQRPKVGVGVMILKENKILLGKRKGSHGEGEYAFPGGHLEYMESFADCARREVNEECGIEIENIHFQYLANIIKYAPKHYTHIGLVADWKSGEPKVLEPEKSESWGWYEIDNLPLPIFEMCKLAVQCHKTGKNYLDVSDLK